MITRELSDARAALPSTPLGLLVLTLLWLLVAGVAGRDAEPARPVAVELSPR